MNQGLIDYIVTPESGFMKHVIKNNINLKVSLPPAQSITHEGQTERSTNKIHLFDDDKRSHSKGDRIIFGSKSGPKISDFGSVSGSGAATGLQSNRKKLFRGDISTSPQHLKSKDSSSLKNSP